MTSTNEGIVKHETLLGYLLKDGPDIGIAPEVLRSAKPYRFTEDAISYCNSITGSIADPDRLSEFIRYNLPPSPITWVEFPLQTEVGILLDARPQHQMLAFVAQRSDETVLRPLIQWELETGGRRHYSALQRKVIKENARQLQKSWSTLPAADQKKLLAESQDSGDTNLLMKAIELLLPRRSGVAFLNQAIRSETSVFVKLYPIITTFFALLSQEKNGLNVVSQPQPASAGSGSTLPAPSTIFLDDLGRGHMTTYTTSNTGQRRRAHWVRGHFVKTGEDRLSWRKPHMRGAGEMTPIPATVKVRSN